MRYTTFFKEQYDALKEPMFFGKPVNVARYDQQKFSIFETLIERQLSFFWRPEEIDLSQDRIDFANLPENEKHIFLSNLKYQTLLDSVQGRSPCVAFLPIVSLPELETWITTWAFSETIHSRSYTHIIRNILSEPGLVFDDIVANQEIKKRAHDITQYYDLLIEKVFLASLQESWNTEQRLDIKKRLYLCLMSVNALEAIRFYVSFACAFAFAERKVMEGNAKIIKLIARDEALHLTGTQHLINILRSGRDDREMKQIATECQPECMAIFDATVAQEKAWARYLFQSGSMIGLNETILCQYVDYISEIRKRAIGLSSAKFPQVSNPIPWINNWLVSDNVQVAPQEVEIASYLVGQIDSEVSEQDFEDFQDV